MNGGRGARGSGPRTVLGAVRRATRRSIPVAADPPRWSACYAPHTSMYFDQFGKVRACCQNTGVYLGDVGTESLRDIWASADAEQLRSALDADDYTAGCEFCAWQLREGNESILFARQYDRFAPVEHRASWPRHMEFSLTNTCNLACAMCNGDWSSTIRAKREGRPPMPAAYGEAFFEQLEEFLPHLEEVAFLGGEPFLGKEPLRVMEMLAELPSPPKVAITTNGTVFTDRVRRIVEMLQPNIVVSLDGATSETYDAIRVGAHLPDVLANVDRFVADLGPGRVSIAHCLMTENWHEFALLLHLLEDRGLDLGVNVVRFPVELSLYQLPVADLRHVVHTMEATDVAALTGRRLAMWRGHVGALRHRLDVLEGDAEGLGPAHGLPGAPDDPTAEALGVVRFPYSWMPFPEVDPDDPGRPLAERPGPVARFTVDTDGIVAVERVDPGLPVDVVAADGGHIDDLKARIEVLCGPEDTWAIEPQAEGEENEVRVRAGVDEPGPTISMQVVARRDEAGALVHGAYQIAVEPEAG